MNTHPYLRAYVAGIFAPTLVLPLMLTVFILLRIGLKCPVPIEQAMIFPMAIVPSLFGLSTCSGCDPMAGREPRSACTERCFRC